MSKSDEYRARLRSLEAWDAYLLEQSGLPGPRCNIELAHVVADEGQLALFQRYSAITSVQAPVNSPLEFLTFCGVIGLGQSLAEGQVGLLESLRIHASDPRWRVREAVAMALQRLGDVNMEQLILAMQAWCTGTMLEQRATAAALCEPRLLGQAAHVRAVLQILDTITTALERADDRRSDSLIALRKGLGYCWSVAVVALPDEGKVLFEKWLASTNPNVQWVMRENLKKARMSRMDDAWVKRWQARDAG